MKTKYLLIGGGLASSQAAKELRDHDAESAITLVGAEPYLPYDRPPLSKEFMRGEKPRDQLFFDSEQEFHSRRISARTGIAIHRLRSGDPRQWPGQRRVDGIRQGATLRFRLHWCGHRTEHRAGQGSGS